MLRVLVRLSLTSAGGNVYDPLSLYNIYIFILLTERSYARHNDDIIMCVHLSVPRFNEIR